MEFILRVLVFCMLGEMLFLVWFCGCDIIFFEIIKILVMGFEIIFFRKSIFMLFFLNRLFLIFKEVK